MVLPSQYFPGNQMVAPSLQTGCTYLPRLTHQSAVPISCHGPRRKPLEPRFRADPSRVAAKVALHRLSTSPDRWRTGGSGSVMQCFPWRPAARVQRSLREMTSEDTAASNKGVWRRGNGATATEHWSGGRNGEEQQTQRKTERRTEIGDG